MFCPNLSDPKVKAQFEKLQSIAPEAAHYLWDKYEGEVPAKYYELSDSPKANVLESRVSKDQIMAHYLRTEVTQDLVQGIMQDTAYAALERREDRLSYIAAKVTSEIDNQLSGYYSVQKVGNRYYFKVSPQSTKVTFQDQAYRTAESLVNSFNKKYIGLEAPVAYFREDANGPFIELSKSHRPYESIETMIDELVAEEIRAEIEMLDRQLALDGEKQALLEKQIEANEIVVDGEVLPYNGELFFRHFEKAKALSKKEMKQYERAFNRLAAKFPGVEWAWDTTIPQAGKIDFESGLILFNPNFMRPDLGFHEFGHILIRAIKQNNPELFESLKAEVERLHQENPEVSSYSRVSDLYNDLAGTEEFWEEVITTELGRQAALAEKPSFFQRIIDWFKSIFSNQNFVPTENTTLNDLVQALVGNEELVDIYELSPEAKTYMESRVFDEELIESMTQYIKTNNQDQTEFQTYAQQVEIIANAITEQEFRKLLDTNKYLGLGNEALNQSLRALSNVKDLITREDMAASVLDLADYMQYSSLYLQGLIGHLNRVMSDPTIPPGKKLGDLHRAHKQAATIKKHIQKIEELFTPEVKAIVRQASTAGRSSVNSNHFLKNLFWINDSLNSIEKIHQENLVTPVLEELSSSLKEQYKQLSDYYNSELEKLRNKKQTDVVKKKIKELEEERDKKLPTPENIKKMLEDPTSPWYLSFDSAMSTKTPSVQLIAGYIKDINNEFIQNLQAVARDWQSLMDDISKVEGAFTGSVIDVKQFYKNYYRETTLLKVENGELIEVPVLALNTPIMTIELRNEITRLKYEIQNAETEEEAERLENQLNKFYEEYTERPFTDEYYEIQKLLPERIRQQRNQLFGEIAAIREEFGMGDVNDDVLERLKMKEKELFDMERFYDDLGQRKTGDPLAIAEAIQEWKDAKRNAATIQYELTEDSKIVFERTLAQRKDKLRKSLAQAKTPAQRDLAQQEYDKWASVYTRTVYTDEFYLERQAIVDQIQDLLSTRTEGGLGDLYQNLFNLLKGNKDQNGEYLPTNVTQEQVKTAKQIEEEIEKVKALLKETSPLGRETKNKLKVLIEQLQDIQGSVNSRHYEDTVEHLKAGLRTQIFQANPTLDDASIERLVHNAFLNSEWYKANHIKKVRWSPTQQAVVEVEEPLFMWRVTRPTNPAHIQEEAPAFVWYKTKVAEEFKNPEYRPGDITFKNVTGGTYYNSKFDSLTAAQKDIMMRMRDLHYRSQDGLYSSDKLGDLIPGLYKSQGEVLLDTIKFQRNPIKRWFQQVRSWFAGDREAFEDSDDITGNADQTDAFGDPVVRESRRLFNRYARTIPADQQSYNIMEAMASYATSSERFRVMRKYQSTVLAMEEVVKSSQGETGARKTVGDLIDRELYGKYANKSTFGNILRGITKMAGFKTLGFNILSLPQNWINGMLSIYSQSGFYGIRKRDILKAQASTVGISRDFYMHYNKFGQKPMSLALVDFFVGTQAPSNQASEIDNRGLTKWGSVWKAVHTMRDFTEFDIAATTTYAFLNKYTVKLKDSDSYIPLKDAFEMKDGLVQARPDVEITPEFISLVRNRIQLANERAQGNYAQVSQPTASKNAWFRMLLFLKKWVIPQFKSTWGTETIHYHSGLKTVGSHMAMGQFVKDALIDPSNFANAWKYAPEHQKAGVKQFMFQYASYAVLANILVQLSLRLKCEEDGVADWKDYACYGLKRTANEAEGVFNLWGLGELYFTFVKEQANGVSIWEKLGWAVAGPLSVYRKFITDHKLYESDPYYKYRPNSSKIDWDRTHPMVAGKSGLSVLGMEIMGARGLALGPKSIEYQNRAFNDYSPKSYTKELRTRFKKDHEGLEEMKTRTPKAQLKKQYKKELKELRTKILAYKQKGEVPPQRLLDRLAALRNNFIKAREELLQGGVDDERGLYFPVPFMPSRQGLDMSPGEIEYMDFEEEGE